jgi:hemerythrin-like domain-containing protein
MEATKCLRDEHQVILRVLDCFDVALVSARQTGEVSRQVFEPFLDFFRGFADKCHHCKEEDRLFPVLEDQGMAREGGPIGVMLYEHEQGRMMVGEMAAHLDAADGGDSEAGKTVLDYGQTFLAMLRQHIEKEDHILFGMADQITRGEDLSQLLTAYRQAEEEDGYGSTYSRCWKIAERLAETYGKPRLPVF